MGEFGLDDGWAKNDDNKFAIQQRIFKQQVSLAIEAKKPMVLHIRGFNALAAAKYILGKSSNKIKIFGYFCSRAFYSYPDWNFFSFEGHAIF